MDSSYFADLFLEDARKAYDKIKYNTFRYRLLLSGLKSVTDSKKARVSSGDTAMS
jgi:hypothetical protein